MPTYQPDHYTILGLDDQRQNAALGAQTIKHAYKKALLRHHPDKAVKSPAKTTRPSIDDIALAYKTLSDPVLRADYDRTPNPTFTRPAQSDDRVTLTGLEEADLDDLDFDVDDGVWSRGCRCGQRRGFVVAEAELEKHVELGELVTGCRGCSLWLKVLFAVQTDGSVG
ncbi:Diphthamide biosynthesis protein 4 [Elasticomyces elasticus]|nr:Diphthamide biosynthesis protein 4 [Elasticomyces elasticus]